MGTKKLKKEDFTPSQLKEMYVKYLEKKRKGGGTPLKPEEWLEKIFGKQEDKTKEDETENPPSEESVNQTLSEPNPEKGKKSFKDKLKSAGGWLKKKIKNYPTELWEKTKYQARSMKNAPKNISKLITGKELSKEEKDELKAAATTTAYIALSAVGFGLLSNSPLVVKGLNSVAKSALSYLTPVRAIARVAFFRRFARKPGDAEGLLLAEAVMKALSKYLDSLSDEQMGQIFEELKKNTEEKSKPKKQIQAGTKLLSPSAERISEEWLRRKSVETYTRRMR